MNEATEAATAGAQSVPITAPKLRKSTKASTWWKRGPNLVQHVSTGTYYARIKIKGKSFRKSLLFDGETSISLETAKLRVSDKIKELLKPKAPLGTFAEARVNYEADLANDHSLAPESKRYRQCRIAALLKSWPGLDETKLEKITESACREWAGRFAAEFEQGNFNNTLGTLRGILTRGGLGRDENPAFKIKKLGVKLKQPELPENDQLEALISTVRSAGARQSCGCADLIAFLAYSGCRISEARLVLWGHVDIDGGEIKVRNAKRGLSSSGPEFRFVPIIPPMRTLLERMKKERRPLPTERVCLLGECEKSMTSACEKIGIKRITHHDLRHLFATRCIESGIDIPTVSRWLGHVDGGALAMRVYGHLRRKHSIAMAQMVNFESSPAENAIPMPQTQVAP